MAERLTDKHTVSVYNNSNSEIYLGENEEATKYIYKLAQLEDVMEKYGIQSAEELDKQLANGFTWQKACELACEREDDCYVYDNIHRAYEFYQQAKTEGIDE